MVAMARTNDAFSRILGGKMTSCLITFLTVIYLAAEPLVKGVHFGEENPCIPKDFGHGSIVCICNSSYCDEIGIIKKPPTGHYVVYTSTKLGMRFHREEHTFNEEKLVKEDAVITLHLDNQLQTILGFGGAISDAAGIQINSLSPNAKLNLMKSYFSREGIEYTLCRVPIGGTDFSTRPYTYDDDHDDDFDLAFFNLAAEDLTHKIPLILEAQDLSSGNLKLIASPWSAPAWMKTNGLLHGFGFLKGEPGGPYYETWANYIIRFLQDYRKYDINFWGLTAQNTPAPLVYGECEFNNMRFTPENQGKFIGSHLGPALEQHGFNTTKIIVGDGVRKMQPKWTEDVLTSDLNASKFVAGTAVHWYLNGIYPPSVLTELHEMFPDKFILATEACEGVGKPPYVLLGSWERGENYAYDIIQDLTHWTVGWIDWNMALDMHGGPNWSGNFVDSALIVDSENDQFFKQPMYYALGHFSKFLPPGSKIIHTTISTYDDDIIYVAGKTPGLATVLVILNRSDNLYGVQIRDTDGNSFFAELLPHSIQTYVW